MKKLTFEILDSLGDPFDVTNVDVKRLRDDRSEIQLGQEVAFVATASFRVTPDARTKLASALPDAALADGDELLAIGSDAELRSDLPIDEDSVARWIHKHYRFDFVLNGKCSPALRPFGPITVKADDPGKTADELVLPWLTKLSTIQVKDDYIDVDVQISERDPTSNTGSSNAVIRGTVGKATLASVTNPNPTDGQGAPALDNVELAIELDLGSAPSDLTTLAGQTFRIGLKADHATARFDLVVTVPPQGSGRTGKLAVRPVAPFPTHKT
jgi:hypothetical protein